MIDFSTLQGLTIPEGVVTQIADASGRVLWSSTIKFTINGDTYIADRGMTWAEWFASDYNTTGKTADDVQSISANGATVELSAVIVGGTAYEVGFGTPISSLAEGTLIRLNYGSGTKQFRILKHDYESGLNGAGRTLLIDEMGSVDMQYSDRIAWNESGVNTYANSTMDSWLNSTYKGRFDGDVQSAMGSTTFYYTPGNGNNTVTTLSRSVFIASHTERFGGTYSNTNVEGSYIPTVTQMGYYKGFGGWYRTPTTNSTNKALYGSYAGSWSKSAPAVTSKYVMYPLFTLPSNFTNYTV